MKGVILQPGYLPWLGFFNQMMESDVFVFLDDVQYDRRGWRNRNRIKGPTGGVWLTVPIVQKGRYEQLLNETVIDDSQNWAQKHLKSIHHFYAACPSYKTYAGELQQMLSSRHQLLVDLDIHLIEFLMKCLGIDKKTLRSSELETRNTDKTGRLIEICLKTGIDEYISGPLCLNYMDYQQFVAAKVRLFLHHYHHPEYHQRFPPFLPNLCILDLLFNEGESSSRILRDRSAFVEHQPG